MNTEQRALNIILVRHGESVANVHGHLYDLRCDAAIGLTPKGITQVVQVGEYLQQHSTSIPVVYSSALTRAMQSAYIIKHVAALRAGVYTKDPLIELTEGLPRADIGPFINDINHVPTASSAAVKVPTIINPKLSLVPLPFKTHVAAYKEFLPRWLGNVDNLLRARSASGASEGAAEGAAENSTLLIVAHELTIKGLITAWNSIHGIDYEDDDREGNPFHTYIENGETIGLFEGGTSYTLFTPKLKYA